MAPSKSWSEGIRSLFGMAPRKPQRVLVKLRKQDRGIQSLEQRVVLSALSVASADAPNQQQDGEQTQEASRRILRSNIVTAARANRLDRLDRLSDNKMPVTSEAGQRHRFVSSNAARSRSASPSSDAMSGQQKTSARTIQFKRNALQNSSLYRSSRLGNQVSTVARTAEAKPTVNRFVRRSSLPTRTTSLADNSRMKSSTQNHAEAMQKLSTSRIRPGILTGSRLMNSSLFQSSRVSTNDMKPARSYISTFSQSRPSSPVKSYVSNLKTRPISLGVHQSSGFSSRISQNSISFTNRIGSPSDYGLSTGRSLGVVDRFWANFNRNYSSTPWHAPANGFSGR